LRVSPARPQRSSTPGAIGSAPGLIVLACAIVALLATPGWGRQPAARARFKAVVFDYLVLFNADSVVPDAEKLFPGRGRELTTLWRARQFEYSWLRSLSGRYADFSTVTRDALEYATQALNLPVTPASRTLLLNTWLHLTPWPDADRTLQALRGSGVRVAALANLTPAMLRSNAESSHLLDRFDALISTDDARVYKPEPRAYALALDRLQLKKEDVLFVASAGWDAAGARAFGYQTYWVNRFNQPAERLGDKPDETSADLRGLLEFAIGQAASRPPRRTATWSSN
jgi:2-haloacid dehalogenase